MRRLQLLAFSLAVLGSTASPPVNISLRTSWPAPPSLIEAIETVALDNPDAFFPLLDRLTDPDVLPSLEKLSPKALHRAVLEVATSHGFVNEPAFMERNLALHASTPKIEAFYNYYDDHHTGSRGTECGSWVDWHGEVICEVAELVRVAGLETIVNTTQSPAPRLLTFDHTHPSLSRVSDRPPRTAILYASPSSPNFRALHSYLLSLADNPEPQLLYVLRHVPPKTRNSGPRSYLTGYGVALNLKKTDYLAVDDRNTQTNGAGKAKTTLDPQVKVDPILDLIENFAEPEPPPSTKTPLTEAELTDLGSKAIQLIANSTTPLVALTHLSQNFPKYASLLGRRVVVNSSLESEIHTNSLKAQPGVHMFWLNGAIVADKDINPLGLLGLLKKERETMSTLTSLGMTTKEALDVLTHASVTEAQQGGMGPLDGLFDASDRIEGGDVVVYWNDIEKDKRYTRWHRSLFALLQPTYGGLPSVRLNLFNLILTLDLSQPKSLAFVAGPMAHMINSGIPLRFGVVPIIETEDGAKMARLFYHLVNKHGRKSALRFFQQVSASQPPDQTSVDWNPIREQYDALVAQAAEQDSDQIFPPLDDVLSEAEKSTGTSSTTLEEKAKAYAERLGTNLASSRTGHAFFNGRHFDFDEDFMRLVQGELGTHVQHLQEKIYTGRIKDEHAGTMSTYFYDQPTTAQRRNRYVFPAKTTGSLRIYHLPDLFSRTGFHVQAMSFLYPSETTVIPLSLYIVADLDSEAGLHLVKESLSSVTLNSRSRITFIHNPLSYSTQTTQRPRTSWLLAHLIASNTLSKASPEQLLQALGLTTTLAAKGTQTILSQDEALHGLTGGVKISDLDASRYAEYVKACRLVAKEAGVAPGQQVILANGRLVGPLEPNDFSAADFSLLEEHEVKRRADPVVRALEDAVGGVAERDRASYAHLISMTASVIAAIQQPDPSETGLFDKPPTPRSTKYKALESNYTVFKLGDNSTALYHIAVVIDPLSETAQRWSSLLQWLSTIPGTFIQVHLNPVPLKEMPLKSFYRYNVVPSLSFDDNGQEAPARAIFEDLPVEPIYTLAMEVPPSWLVRPREALYDLDNIQLGHLLPGDTSVDAVFDLDYLVIEGHSREDATNSPPRGVQLELVRGGNSSTPIDDTQVVANLGYIQFKAKPGVFGLDIRKGRGRELFRMESVGNEGWDSKTVEEVGNEVTVTSFDGVTLYPRLARNEGMEDEDVLAEPMLEKGIFEDLASRVTSIFKPKHSQVEEQAEINIFTVASGLLYERFASIMILSVLRNTKSTVKFWFIENFLSPSFLEFIPHMAEKYDFKYELVTYKWPSWLREQTEKQRIIWAYKILFLDVLFPMDLKKVIFVDADQIVRADLKELVDLDLHGAPYGYTPMGDDNRDMEGFRFWKTGYWKEFLAGKPYHISALYVIDLVRFRQLAAGDILRGQYQALSADPNSLANLDQDLPNNLQREVPIYSLHEDWLWCETWCSKDRLNRAKTIDLCQNPLTKEPKLSRARQIPEWEEYDGEIARFTRKLAEEGLIRSGMAAADTNVLANAGTVPLVSEDGDMGSAQDAILETGDDVHERSRDEL